MAARLGFLTLNLLILLVSCAAALLLGEGAVRVVAPQQLILINPELWQPHDSVGWVRRPNVATRINTGERTVQVFTDEWGFRIGQDRDRDGDVRILLLGDSFMEALQVEYEQSLAGLLEEQLSERLGKRVVVSNAGVSGWAPDQYYLRARSLLETHDFDLVITSLYVGDDPILGRRERIPPREAVERKRLRVPRQASWGEVVDAILHPVNDVLEVRSQLFLFFKNRLTVLRMRFDLTPAYFPPLLRTAEAESPRWQNTAEIGRDIEEVAAARGAPALFVLVPAHFQVYSEAFAQYVRGFNVDTAEVDLDQPNRLLADHFAVHDLHVVDALPALRAARESSDRLYGRVDTHLSPAGHVVLASIVVPAAARLLAGD